MKLCQHQLGCYFPPKFEFIDRGGFRVQTCSIHAAHYETAPDWSPCAFTFPSPEFPNVVLIDDHRGRDTHLLSELEDHEASVEADEFHDRAGCVSCRILAWLDGAA